jgi:hypothetical protein
MNTLFLRRNLLAVTVAVAAALGQPTRVPAQPAPPTAADNALPPDIDPASSSAQVIKLVQAGTDISVINAYVANSASLFNLDADQIVALKDAGVPTDVINAMMSHDKSLGAQVPAPTPASAPAPESVSAEPAPPSGYAPAPSAAPTPDAGPDTAPPATPVTVEYFNNNLAPYGSWVDVNGYGRCWRPTVVIYDNNWSPYCDRGHWVYTDCGWYWSSDYSWGATFHYGRWFRDGRIGWCWHPDTEWAPSWVVWRSSTDYCGWAPLPPFAVFHPGAGFFYRGVSVGVDFNFGLGANCFVFLSPDHLCDRRPRSFCIDQPRVIQVFNHTTIINHFDSRDHVLVNRGIAIDQINARSHRNIQPVKVGSLPNSRREGWQGTVTAHQGAPRNYSNQNQNNNNPSQGNSVQSQNHAPENHAPTTHPNYNNNNSPSVNHVPNQGSQNNNPYHPQTYSPPKTPAPAPNNHFDQGNNPRVEQHPVIAPTTPAPPVEHYSSGPPAQQQQRAQQNQVHTYNGASDSRYNSRPQSPQAPPSKGSGQGPGSSQGSSHDSGSDRQNH